MNLRLFLRDVLPLLVWMGMIFSLSTRAGTSTHTNSVVDDLLARFFPHWSARLTWPERDAIHFYLRKTAHVTEYTVLGGLAGRALRHNLRKGPRLLLGAWLLATLYAATDEFHQSFVPGRTPLITDVLIDSTGAAVGVALFALVSRSRRS